VFIVFPDLISDQSLAYFVLKSLALQIFLAQKSFCEKTYRIIAIISSDALLSLVIMRSITFAQEAKSFGAISFGLNSEIFFQSSFAIRKDSSLAGFLEISLDISFLIWVLVSGIGGGIFRVDTEFSVS
jgi:hypothetical protein